jgi:aminoglycoside 6'-N-acetyltransferase I
MIGRVSNSICDHKNDREFGLEIMHITDLQPTDRVLIDQVAAMLVTAFRDHTLSWPDHAAGMEEVQQSFGAGRISRVALDDVGNAIGWVGGIEQYDGNVWELHPLVVRPDQQGRGVGRALVEDFERVVHTTTAATTIWLGTDDEDGRTSLSGVDLYPDPWTHIANIRNPGGHPYEFYRRMGFAIVGVMPDANGPGKPDIFMSKRIER